MGTYTITKVLGAYNLISGGFNGSGESYFQSIVGNGVNATQTTSNYYSSGSGTTAIFTYNMSFSDLPSDMTNISCSLNVNGHPESTSSDDEYMCVQLKSGSTTLTEKYNFKSSGETSNTTHALSWSRTPTRAQLLNLTLECTLGYYGGAINGATLSLTYTSSTAPSSSSTHAVYFGYGGQAKKVSKIYFGYGGQAKKVKKGYIGIGGAAKLFYTAEEPLTYTYTGTYTESTVGSYTVLRLTTGGTLTFSRDCTIDIWMCGGGSGGGRAMSGQGGGGGGGGHISTSSNQSMSGATSYTVSIGSGGSQNITGGTTSIKQGSTTIISASGGNISDGGSGGGGRGKSSTAGAGSGGDGDGSGGGPFRPFNSSSYYSSYTCAGGGGGASYRYSFSLQGRGYGGDGGTQGDDGENGGTSGSAGGTGGGSAGDGGDSVSSGTARNGSSASGYGNGGGGGGGYYYEESTNNATQNNGTGGSGTQGVCFIRFLVSS